MEIAAVEEQTRLNELYEQLDNPNYGAIDYDQIGELNLILKQTTATEEEILSGYKAYSKGSLLTGTMVNNGAINQTIDAGESYTIPKGYHNGEGIITANESSGSFELNTESIVFNSSNSWGAAQESSQITWTPEVTLPVGYENFILICSASTATNTNTITGLTTTAQYSLKNTFSVNGCQILTYQVSKNKDEEVTVTVSGNVKLCSNNNWGGWGHVGIQAIPVV